MSKRLADIFSGFLIATLFALAFWAIDRIPDGAQIVVHWGPNGEPNGWMGKWAGMLFIPVMAVTATFAVSVVPEGYAFPGKLPLPEHAKRALLVCVLFVQTIAEAAIALNALGIKIDPSNYLSFGIGVTFIVVGMTFSKLSWNFLFFRKAIFSDVVAQRTNRVGRLTYMTGGVVIIAATFIAPSEYKAALVSAVTIGTPLGFLLYSFIVSLR